MKNVYNFFLSLSPSNHLSLRIFKRYCSLAINEMKIDVFPTLFLFLTHHFSHSVRNPLTHKPISIFTILLFLLFFFHQSSLLCASWCTVYQNVTRPIVGPKIASTFTSQWKMNSHSSMSANNSKNFRVAC